MSSDRASWGEESVAGVDTEHQVQIGLARALCDALRPAGDLGQVREIFDQLVRYSEVHFMSEQLLMRLCSYPGYEEHVLEHDGMTEMLAAIADRHGAGEQILTLDEAQNMVSSLSRHIADRDQRFTAYYRDWARRGNNPRPAELG